MDNQPTDRRDDDAVQKSTIWLDQVAEAEGVTREEAIEFLISSYWQLKEVTDVLEEVETTQDPASGAPDEASAEPSGTEFDWNVDEDPETPEGTAAETADIQRLLGAVDDVFDRLDDFEDAVNQLAEVNEHVERVDSTAIENLDDRLREAEDTLETVDEAISALDDRTTSLREESARAARVDELAAEVLAIQDATTNRHDDLRDKVTDEFENIRTILEHLIEARGGEGDRSAPRLDAVQKRLEAIQLDRERVATITRLANREGLRAADCGHCGRTIDLGLLETAQCPNCEHVFTDLRATNGLLGLFRSATLVVVDQPGSQ